MNDLDELYETNFFEFQEFFMQIIMTTIYQALSPTLECAKLYVIERIAKVPHASQESSFVLSVIMGV
jgi:hypothetical protein